MHRLFSLFIIFLYVTCNDVSKGYSQIVFKVVPPEEASICTIHVGESFQIKFELSTQEEKVPVHEFTPPIFNGLTVIKGPEVGNFSSTTVTNGSEKRRNGCAYTYTLKATEKGTYIIPKTSIKINNVEQKSDPVTINAVPAPSNHKIDRKIDFKVCVPESAESGAQFNLYFEINVKNGKNFQSPIFEGLEMLSGPIENILESKNHKNGATETVIQHQYTFDLKSSKKGILTIPPASITVDGVVYKTQETKIRIL